MKLPDHITYAPLILKQFLFYQKSWRWSKQQVLDFQNEKLKEIVKYAGKYVPYYINLFEDIGLDTSTFRGIEDIEKIPLLDKEAIRTNPQDFVSYVSKELGTQILKTSGSTGTPLTLHIDKISRANKYACFARAYFWAGYKPGALRFVLKGFSESKKEPYGYDLLRNMIYLNSSKMDKDNCLAAAKLVAKFKPVIFEGYARSFVDFYNFIDNSYQIKPPKGIFVYGETVPEQIREFLQTNFQTHLYDYYAHEENAVLICETPDYEKRLMDDYFYSEFINENGEATDADYGELVGTSFYNYAMPLIRYKTRDFVKLGEEYGVPFRKVNAIEGRMDDYLLLPDGSRRFLFEGAINYADGVVVAQFVQNKVDQVTVNLIVDDDFRLEYCNEIEKGMKKRLGPSLKYTFKIVDELEKKKSGKAPFIINKISDENLGAE